MMLGDWMRRVSESNRLVTDTTIESARESWDKSCGALTPIIRGEKFESVILPTASARKSFDPGCSTCASDILGDRRPLTFPCRPAFWSLDPRAGKGYSRVIRIMPRLGRIVPKATRSRFTLKDPPII